MAANSTPLQKKMNREQIKEILQTNFNLFKDQENFFDYITTLVIYIMKYEYEEDDKEKRTTQSDGNFIPTISRGITSKTMPTTRRKDVIEICPHCQSQVSQGSDICQNCHGLLVRNATRSFHR